MALVVDQAIAHRRLLSRGKTKAEESITASTPGKAVGSIDYRLVLIGSLLPDIIDKPIGHYFLSGAFHDNGRIFSHTVLFALILISIGIFRLMHSRKTGVLVLSLCSAGHLALDKMWQIPETLYWPLQGWSFPANDYTDWWDWLSGLYDGLSANPSNYIAEITGMTVIALALMGLLFTGRLFRFLKTGALR